MHQTTRSHTVHMVVNWNEENVLHKKNPNVAKFFKVHKSPYQKKMFRQFLSCKGILKNLRGEHNHKSYP